ncbi:3-hydroxybutyryl-CoA dehydrogenase [Glycine soja]|uniref:3-hydroxybutyryl-CoA dehydrogenase n=1 Tax=Glycine soja TaxID=3848 RepID=A0A0B2REQ3_GLYSO|nr:3-hydroxybutyryl-CoA dehydrogenase [Glycine soja]
MLEVKRIGVVGSGQMGSGIAQVAAMHGIDVWLHDLDPQALSKASSSISSSINRFVSKNHISQVAGADALKRLRLTTDLEDLQLADLIIEAIVESEDVKKSLFAQLDRIAKSSAILASNTSSISVTRLATSTSRPRQVIGMHFMNPPPVMKLIEIVRGADTSEETFVATKALSERLGKHFFALYTGVATKEDIDTGMKLGTNHPMGPLELADFIGLDVCLSIMRVLHAGLGDNKYAPCPLLVQYVDAGRLGRKRGIGVYEYSKDPRSTKSSSRL